MTRLGTRQRPADHVKTAADARATPGQWTPVNIYRNVLSGDSIAREILAGRLAPYQPQGAFEAYAAACDGGTAVWVRYVAGVDVEPLPKTITVRVPDYGTQVAFEGVAIRTLKVGSTCPRCGAPRGPVRPDRFVRDGQYLVRDAWTNPCGHQDMYFAVIAEARRRQGRQSVPRVKGRELRGVEGGRFTEAVNTIARLLASKPYLRALPAAGLLEEEGYSVAAQIVRAYAMQDTTRGQTSARSAALYLIDRDKQGPEARTPHTKGGGQ